ncbi:MAG: nucleotide-binding protein [Verrucomicrobia bacterium]|nr:nucleotide-binding protein [Verrucomicrobiota bacterium]
MTTSDNKQENPKDQITALEAFKREVEKWADGNLLPSEEKATRSYINRNTRMIQELVWRAGCGKLMTVSPPPAVGGLIMRNVDPFSSLFQGPYGVNMSPVVLDMIDETIGVIESGKLPAKKTNEQQEPRKSTKATSNRKVFLVHGRDNEVKQAVARFLEKLDLEPIILHERTNSGLTIIEKFERNSDVAFAVVLMTPDDYGGIKENLPPQRDRARQNVVFELGYFMGKLGRNRVTALLKGDLERPSDSDGIIYIALDPNDGWKILLAKELKEAGLTIDLNKVV